MIKKFHFSFWGQTGLAQELQTGNCFINFLWLFPQINHTDLWTTYFGSPFFFVLCTQSHYREISRWEILWNRNWDLGWIWASWHYILKKKIGSIMSNFLGRFFQVFMGKKKFKNQKHCSVLKRLKKYCFFKHFIS